MSSPLQARGVVRFLGSLTFLLIILVSMLLAFILPTVVNQFVDPDLGYDRTVGALRRDWYGAWWFNVLMALLMVNLTVCTVIRTPWRYFWMWGFLITHSGILTLMIGAAVTFNTKIYGDLQAFEGESYDYFTIENENELVVRSSDGERAAFQIRTNPYRRSAERKTFKLADAHVYLHVDEYVPNVAVEPTYREGTRGGEILAEVAAHEPGAEPKKAILKLGQPMHYGVMALAALKLGDESFADMSEPPGESGILAIEIGGEKRELDIAAEKGKTARVGDADVRVKSWGSPTEKDRDFWVEFDVTRAGATETWRARAIVDDQPLVRVGGENSPPQFKARFRPRFTPEAVHGKGTMGVLYVCETPSGLKYLFISSKGDRSAGQMKPGARLSNPFMPQRVLELELVRWMDHAEETVEETEPRKNRPRNPALRVTAELGGHRQTRWVKFFGEPVSFDLGAGEVQVAFRGRQYRDLPFTLGLDDFRVTFNRGTMSPKHFESDLTLTDHETGEVTKKTIEVNTPMKYKGFVIYQSGWNEGERRMSIFQISKDPGKKILYLGWVMAVSGSIFMFFLKPFLQKLIKTGSRGEDAPLRSAPALLLFALVTLGTVAGMVGPLLFPNVDPLWLGLGVAGADLVLALAVALIARHWRELKPTRALQTGEILAAGWCLNTAALVILLMMKVTA
ncbi:MAG TPA: cytochrome c biogenesis protein ResB [Planctomycetota bacterium]|nr:cytochrome c biogenesis protein ResB [Planctomycetota bacterium]